MNAHSEPTDSVDLSIRGRFWLGVWRVADPKITLASAASMLVGSCAAARDGPVSWGWLALAMLGVLLVEAAKNMSGEIFDWDSGVDLAVDEEDRSPFSGGKRVLVDRLMSRSQAVGVAFVLYFAAVLVGTAIVVFREPRVVVIGAVGIALAFFYHAPPLKLSYRGFGELAVGIVYGPLIAAGVYLVQRQELSWTPILAATPLGLLIAGFLWINEFPDHDADLSAGKRTLVVRVGRRIASRIYPSIVACAFTLLLCLPVTGLPISTSFGLAGLPHAVAAAARLLRYPERSERVVAAQKWSLLSFVLLAAGTGLGLLLP